MELQRACTLSGARTKHPAARNRRRGRRGQTARGPVSPPPPAPADNPSRRQPSSCRVPPAAVDGGRGHLSCGWAAHRCQRRLTVPPAARANGIPAPAQRSMPPPPCWMPHRRPADCWPIAPSGEAVRRHLLTTVSAAQQYPRRARRTQPPQHIRLPTALGANASAAIASAARCVMQQRPYPCRLVARRHCSTPHAHVPGVNARNI